MNPETLFRIVGFDQSLPWPTQSWVIAGGNTDAPRECEACGSEVDPRSVLCVEGYDEYATGNFRERAFWPNDEELITLRPFAEEIAVSLTGVVAVPVAYTDWNQSRLSEQQLASKEPQLGALEIVGKAAGAYHAEAGILQSCAVCGAIARSRWARRSERLLPPLSSWDGSDVFVIAGTDRRFVTSPGLSKLRHLGFRNLRLEETSWHLGD